MTVEMTKEKVLAAIESAGIDADLSKADLTDNLVEEHDLDSLDMFNIYVELQAISGLEIPDEDIDNLKTIQSMMDYFNNQ